MGASTSLSSTELIVAPGSEARTTLRVRNTGAVVDQFELAVLGTAAEWGSVEPPSISLFPGAEQTVDVVFRPAKLSSIAAGRTTFAVKASSHEDPQGSSVEEGVIDVLPFDDRTAELIPRTSKGKRSATHELAVDNRGNAPVNVSLSGLDPEGTLGYEFQPVSLVIAPGTAQFAKVKVIPAQRFWRGTNKTLPFAISADELGQPPLVVDGTMVQVPILPKWFWKAVLAVLAVLLLLVILWFALVKPQIKSSAKDAVAPIDNRLDAANIPELPAGGGAPSGGPSGSATTTTVAGSGGEVPTTTTLPSGSASGSSFGDPVATRLQVQAAAGASAPVAFPIPAGQTFALTDIVLQNPQGDTGRVKLERPGLVLLDLSLENFRISDLHTISPYIVNGGDSITMTITCTTPGPGASQCDDAALLSGFQK